MVLLNFLPILKNQFACGKMVAVHTKLAFHFNVRPVKFVFVS
jgi:hypothetical protein